MILVMMQQCEGASGDAGGTVAAEGGGTASAPCGVSGGHETEGNLHQRPHRITTRPRWMADYDCSSSFF